MYLEGPQGCQLDQRNLCQNSFVRHGLLQHGTQWNEYHQKRSGAWPTTDSPWKKSRLEVTQWGLWNTQNPEPWKQRYVWYPSELLFPQVLWEILHLLVTQIDRYIRLKARHACSHHCKQNVRMASGPTCQCKSGMCKGEVFTVLAVHETSNNKISIIFPKILLSNKYK